MPQVIVNKQNDLTQTWAVATGVGTLTISNNMYFDMKLTDILRIEDTTQGTVFGISATTTFASSFVSGLPVFVWTFTNLPAGTVTGDTLLVYISVQPDQLNAMLLQYQKA